MLKTSATAWASLMVSRNRAQLSEQTTNFQAEHAVPISGGNRCHPTAWRFFPFESVLQVMTFAGEPARASRIRVPAAVRTASLNADGSLYVGIPPNAEADSNTSLTTYVTLKPVDPKETGD